MKQSTTKKLLKMTSELYEKEAQSFSDTRKDVWEKEIIDFVSQIKPGSSILDLGCGNGRLLAQIQKSKIYSHVLQNTRIDYLGIDFSKKLIELNRIKYPEAEFKVGDGLKLKYKNKFDYIICIAALHHIPSEELQLKFLQNIYNSLKPGGKTLISTWNRLQDKYVKLQNQKLKVKNQNNGITKLLDSGELGENDQIVPWKQSGRYRYIHVFTPDELKNFAQKAEFKNIKVAASKHGQKTNIKEALGIYLIGEK